MVTSTLTLVMKMTKGPLVSIAVFESAFNMSGASARDLINMSKTVTSCSGSVPSSRWLLIHYREIVISCFMPARGEKSTSNSYNITGHGTSLLVALAMSKIARDPS